MFSAEVTSSSGVVVRPWVVPGVVAMVGALGVFVVAGRLSGPLLVVGPAGVVAVPVGAVVVGTLAGAAASVLLTRLAQRAPRPRRLYLLLVAAGLLLSAVPPLQTATEASTAAWLLALHAVVAAVVVPTGLRRLGPERSR